METHAQNDSANANAKGSLPIPIELYAHIFSKLDARSMKTARLVCRQWNTEILSHVPLDIIVNDTQLGNIKFATRVNRLQSLKVTELRRHNYSKFSLLKLHRVAALSLRCQAPAGLKVKFFSDSCCSLSDLNFHRPVLGIIDFQSQKQAHASRGSGVILFPNLQRLRILHVDNYGYRCDGRQVQLVSKNICYLLEVIATHGRLKALDIQINAHFYDVNTCDGRRPWRFEDGTLPAFICRQPMLEDLNLDIPIYSPDVTPYAPRSKSKVAAYPTGLKNVHVVNRIGVSVLADGWMPAAVEHPDLLQWDESFYQNLRTRPQASSFWRNFFLAQKKLQTLDFVNSSHLGCSATFIGGIVANNKASLTTFVMEGQFAGAGAEGEGSINCDTMKDSKLEKLYLCNVLYDDLLPGAPGGQAPGDAAIVNVSCLPPTLKTLTLINIRLKYEEILAIADSHPQLTSLGLLYSKNHYIRLEEHPHLGEIVYHFATHRTLDDLMLGLVNPDIAEALDLEEWCDEEDCTILIP